MLANRIARRFSSFYSFKTGLPVSFKPEVQLPQIQKEYQGLIFDKELECCDHSNVDFLYKLYLHAILTHKPYILYHFAEHTLADRIDQFIRLIKDTGLKVSVPENVDSLKSIRSRVEKCRLKKTDDKEYIRRSVRDLYADVDTKVRFRGSLRVFGVLGNKDQNKTFLDYDVKASRGNLVYTEKKVEIPDEVRHKIANNSSLEKLGEAKGMKLTADEKTSEQLKGKSDLNTIEQAMSIGKTFKGIYMIT